MSINKRRVLTIASKVDIIRRLQNGVKKADLGREFGLASSSLCSIWANREKILNTFAQNGSKLKRIRKPLRKDLDDALYSWYVEQKINNELVNGPLLRSKAKELAILAGYTDFLCSTGWVDRFKARHDIVFGKICDKSNSINFNVNKWEFYKVKEENLIEENDVFGIKSTEPEHLEVAPDTFENEVYEETVEKPSPPFVEEVVEEKEDDNKDIQLNLVENVSKEESFDELDYFAKYIIAQLRKMPQSNALRCQEQIQRIIISEHMIIDSNICKIATDNYVKLGTYSPSVSPRLA